jgi:hypothetical protein
MIHDVAPPGLSGSLRPQPIGCKDSLASLPGVSPLTSASRDAGLLADVAHLTDHKDVSDQGRRARRQGRGSARDDHTRGCGTWPLAGLARMAVHRWPAPDALICRWGRVGLHAVASPSPSPVTRPGTRSRPRSTLVARFAACDPRICLSRSSPSPGPLRQRQRG